ncbi:uncharacterized protein SCDLUD_001973 [Saccharomycodes ludwigii]|uniref:uncharacterized protein n=1 Tax=Saccharomycodes ludwigii TaxID=36035 RepID=UPI001E8C4174|nr:hypothetical protein SCDLUD_001973 [Saccharomycodes ludwigii]KAH3902160.1 hypothetical protein SCDLUD_001973 [Saccharomycodes ludwigii]
MYIDLFQKTCGGKFDFIFKDFDRHSIETSIFLFEEHLKNFCKQKLHSLSFDGWSSKNSKHHFNAYNVMVLLPGKGKISYLLDLIVDGAKNSNDITNELKHMVVNYNNLVPNVVASVSDNAASVIKANKNFCGTRIEQVRCFPHILGIIFNTIYKNITIIKEDTDIKNQFVDVSDICAQQVIGKDSISEDYIRTRLTEYSATASHTSQDAVIDNGEDNYSTSKEISDDLVSSLIENTIESSVTDEGLENSVFDFKGLRQAIKKVHSLHNSFARNRNTITEFSKKILNKELTIKFACKTRWGSYYEQLKRFIELKPVFQSDLFISEYGSKDFILTEKQFDLILLRCLLIT